MLDNYVKCDRNDSKAKCDNNGWCDSYDKFDIDDKCDNNAKCDRYDGCDSDVWICMWQ